MVLTAQGGKPPAPPSAGSDRGMMQLAPSVFAPAENDAHGPDGTVGGQGAYRSRSWPSTCCTWTARTCVPGPWLSASELSTTSSCKMSTSRAGSRCGGRIFGRRRCLDARRIRRQPTLKAEGLPPRCQHQAQHSPSATRHLERRQAFCVLMGSTRPTEIPEQPIFVDDHGIA